METRKCDKCGAETSRDHYRNNGGRCESCVGAAKARIAAEKAAVSGPPKPAAPVGEVTVTEVVFGGHHSDQMEFERGVDEAGNKWVRCRRCGTIHAAVAHSDEIGDGQRTHFTRSEYPWSDWTPR